MPAASAVMSAARSISSSAPAAATTSTRADPAAASTSSSRWVGPGKHRTRRRIVSRRRGLSGSGCGSSDRPLSWAGVRLTAASASASGRPPVRSTSCRTTSGTTSIPARSASSCPAAIASRPPSRVSGTPAGANGRPSPSRTATSRTTPSRRRRRATNERAPADAGSSHWASSTTHSRGRSRAARVRRASTAVLTRKSSDRSSGPPPSSAAVSGARSRSGSSWASGSAGWRSCWSAANDMADSARSPRPRSTRMPLALPTA